MSEWQPIETAPKETRVLLWVPLDKQKWAIRSGGYDLYYGRWFYDGPQDDHQPTHWVPLPDPPKDHP